MTMAPDKADRILDVLSEQGQRLARIEERQKDLHDLRDAIRGNSQRLTRMETEQAATKGKLAVIGSVFGAAAAGLVALLKYLLGSGGGGQ